MNTKKQKSIDKFLKEVQKYSKICCILFEKEGFFINDINDIIKNMSWHNKKIKQLIKKFK